MQTIKLELNDDLCKILLAKNIDIQKKIKDYLQNLAKDEPKTVNKEEAEKRVQDTLNSYYQDKSSFSAFNEDYKKSLLKIIESV